MSPLAPEKGSKWAIFTSWWLLGIATEHPGQVGVRRAR
jgi:hypothetical protein